MWFTGSTLWVHGDLESSRKIASHVEGTEKSVVGKQKETWVATAANEWQSCWLKDAINKEITRLVSGKITGRTKVRKRCQRGTRQHQRSGSWQMQVHSVILQQTTKTEKTDCGDALKIRTQSACLGCLHPPKTPLHSSSGTESQAQAETECGPPAETVGLRNSNRQPCSVTVELPAVWLTTAFRQTWSKCKGIPTPREIETSQRNCSHVWRDLVWNMQHVFWLYLVLIMTCKAETRNVILHWVPPVRHELW